MKTSKNTIKKAQDLNRNTTNVTLKKLLGDLSFGNLTDEQIFELATVDNEEFKLLFLIDLVEKNKEFLSSYISKDGGNTLQVWDIYCYYYYNYSKKSPNLQNEYCDEFLKKHAKTLLENNAFRVFIDKNNSYKSSLITASLRNDLKDVDEKRPLSFIKYALSHSAEFVAAILPYAQNFNIYLPERNVIDVTFLKAIEEGMINPEGMQTYCNHTVKPSNWFVVIINWFYELIFGPDSKLQLAKILEPKIQVVKENIATREKDTVLEPLAAEHSVLDKMLAEIDELFIKDSNSVSPAQVMKTPAISEAAPLYRPAPRTPEPVRKQVVQAPETPEQKQVVRAPATPEPVRRQVVRAPETPEPVKSILRAPATPEPVKPVVRAPATPEPVKPVVRAPATPEPVKSILRAPATPEPVKPVVRAPETPEPVQKQGVRAPETPQKPPLVVAVPQTPSPKKSAVYAPITPEQLHKKAPETPERLQRAPRAPATPVQETPVLSPVHKQGVFGNSRKTSQQNTMPLSYPLVEQDENGNRQESRISGDFPVTDVIISLAKTFQQVKVSPVQKPTVRRNLGDIFAQMPSRPCATESREDFSLPTTPSMTRV